MTQKEVIEIVKESKLSESPLNISQLSITKENIRTNFGEPI
jgi:hypothetical protein